MGSAKLHSRRGKKLIDKFSNKVKKFDDYIYGDIFNSFHMEMKDEKNVIVEGCENIGEYDENIVKIFLKKMSISFFGSNLKIKCLTSDSLIINGDISSIEFLKL